MNETSRLVCPLCPLHCDDVSVSSSGQIRAAGCSIAESVSATRSGSARNVDAALKKIHAYQGRIRVLTEGVDLVTAKGLLELQRQDRIEVVVDSDPSIAALSTVTRRDGIVTATMSDVVAHADLVWVIGDAETAWPRLFEKLRLDQKSVRTWRQWTAEQAAEMHLAIANGLTDSASDNVHAFLASRYAAIIVAPNAFPVAEAEMIAAMVARLTRHRNETARCVCVTLDPATTLRSVYAWQTNQTLSSIGAADGSPVIRLSGIAPGGAKSIASDSAPIVDLQIGGEDSGQDQAFGFLAASAWSTSMVIRGDGSVTLPLDPPARTSNSHPSALATLRDVLGSM